MKKRIIKCLSFMIIGVLIMGMMTSLSGCGIYTKEDLAEYTKQRLKEEYGEDFEIKTVYKDGHTTIAYPVNDPELLFETWYYMSNGNGNNTYIQAIVEEQFKELIEEKLKDFEYKYYVNVHVGWSELPEASTDITIEKHDELTKGTPQYTPRFYLYLSSDCLNLSDKELYNMLLSIASIHQCGITVYIIQNSDFIMILDDYSSDVSLSNSTYNYIISTYEMFSIGLDGEERITRNLEEFEEIMTEVRNNELYR